MIFLMLELWPYVLGALAIGLATGWFCGCAPRRNRAAPDEPAETPAEARP